MFFERTLFRFEWLYFLPAFIPMLFLVIAVVISVINEKKNNEVKYSNKEEENDQTIPILDNEHYQVTEQNDISQKNNTQQTKQQPILNLNTQTNAIKGENSKQI
jgi:preprotein translocase subunit SecG